MQENMAWLAENYQLGIGVATGVLMFLYAIIGVLICWRARRCGFDVAACTMIPVWRWCYPIRVLFRKRSIRRAELLKDMAKKKTTEEDGVKAGA